MDLFTHELEYRTKELLEKTAKIRLMFAGCGAIGSNLIDNMARQGFKSLAVIDMDRVEDHNKGTQIWDRLDVGGLKVDKMKTKIYNSTGSVLVTNGKKLHEDNIKRFIKPSSYDIVIDSFDNSESRGLLYRYCRENKMDCLHVGLSQDFAEVIWNEDYTVPGEPKGLDVCEYPLARNIILLAIAVATETIIKMIDTGEKKNFLISLKDLKISELG